MSNTTSTRFEGKSFVVTGGAMGIGAATVERLAAEGAHVFIADRNREAAQEVVERVVGQRGSVRFVAVDLGDEHSIAAMAAAVLAEQASLHGLVNNAGVVRPAALEKVAAGDWDLQLAVNLKAPLLCTRALLAGLGAGGASVVNVSSEAAFRPRPNNAIYDASKAGVGALTRSLASELAERGIRVNTVAPGWTVTEMHTGRGDDAAKRRAELEGLDNPGCILRRLGRPAEIAAAIAFLLSDDASFMTATTLHVDGGRVAN